MSTHLLVGVDLPGVDEGDVPQVLPLEGLPRG